MFAEPQLIDDGLHDPVLDRWVEDGELLEFEPPDAVDRVVEVANMMSVFAADRLVNVAALRDEAISDARARGSRVSVEILDRSVRLELAAALRITEYAAGEMLALAEALTHRHRPVLYALHRADITEQHAAILVAGVDSIEPEHRALVLERGLSLAETESVGTFRRMLRAMIDDLRSPSLAERHESAVRHRRVAVETAADGMGWLHLYAPAVEVTAIHGRATAIAKSLRGEESETRSLDQLRADAVCDLLIDGSTTGHSAEARGIRATVVVTVPVLSLLERGSREPATVEGVGPVPLARARELCGGTRDWMRVLTHPETGMVLSVGRDRYAPPASLRKLVTWRAERCMAPGCGVPAARCQIDHTVAWEHGGSTSIGNLSPLCQGHHTVKHHGGWMVRQIEGGGGAIEWISPMGRRYVVQPERRVPVFQPQDAGLPPPF
ncbi:MAG: DUF222 domain-containing protein [Microbacterium sp.]